MTVLLASLVVTAATAPMVRRVLRRRGVMDVPNGRSSHSVSVPRGGGLACVAGAATGLAVAFFQHRQVSWLPLVAVALLAVTGFADDRGGVRAAQRLLVQVLAGAFVGWTVGGPAWIPVAALVLPVTVNAVNFMDGINGITGLNGALWGAVAMYVGSGSSALAVIGAVVVGASLGFLPWNAPTARLFLGDVGSYFFGAMMGVGILEGARLGVHATVVLVAPLSVYLTDTGVTLLRRARHGAPLMTAHRQHAYQRLVDEARLPHFVVAAVTAAVALAITAGWRWLPIPAAVALMLVLLVAYVTAVDVCRWLRAGLRTWPDGIAR